MMNTADAANGSKDSPFNHSIKQFDMRLNEVRCTCGWVYYFGTVPEGRGKHASHRLDSMTIAR